MITQDSDQNENEDEFDLSGDDDLDIEIVDDSPSDESIAAAVAGGDDDEDELKSYSENVQKRIKKETAKSYRFKREAEESRTRETAAIEFARTIAAENEELKRRNSETRDNAISLTKTAADQAVEGLQEQLSAAYEEGDGKKIADLTIKLQRAVIDQQNVNAAEREVKREKETREASKGNQGEQRQQQQQQTRPQIPEAQREWYESNPWFKVGENGPIGEASKEAHAYSVYLINRGMDMADPEFYEKVNAHMAETHPDVVGAKKKSSKPPAMGGGAKAGSSQKPASKSNIVLSKGEVAMALELKPSYWTGTDKEWLKKYHANKVKYESQNRGAE